jgi:hypothetical protein
LAADARRGGLAPAALLAVISTAGRWPMMMDRCVHPGVHNDPSSCRPPKFALLLAVI